MYLTCKSDHVIVIALSLFLYINILLHHSDLYLSVAKGGSGKAVLSAPAHRQPLGETACVGGVLVGERVGVVSG